jgi:mono/diheme cytochrome c family protein
VLLSLTSGCASVPGAGSDARHDATAAAESVTRGKTIYLVNCAPCHGPTAEGNGPLAVDFDPPPPNLVAAGIHVAVRGIHLVIATPHYSSRLLEESITEGSGSMPAWKDRLTEQQIDDIVAYVRFLIEQQDRSS